MQEVLCAGREHFENLVPFGSEKNRCPLGFGVDCANCKFYRSN